MRAISFLLVMVLASVACAAPCGQRRVVVQPGQRVVVRAGQTVRVQLNNRNRDFVANQGNTLFGVDNLSFRDFVSGEDDSGGDVFPKQSTVRTTKATAVVNKSCLGCHSAVKKSGGLDLSDLSLIDNSTRELIRERVTSDDPELRMPKGKAIDKQAMDALLRFTFEAAEQ